jgi:hypothetical protein
MHEDDTVTNLAGFGGIVVGAMVAYLVRPVAVFLVPDPIESASGRCVRARHGASPTFSWRTTYTGRQGFIWDGLISHQFLRNYASWTLDFDLMTYIFQR